MLIRNFNTSDVKESIKYLSSDEFEGRLSGTLENTLASSYIKDEFQAIGLKPFGDSYYENFNVNYPKSSSEEPMIAILDENGKVHKILEYGVNYKEDLLNFRNTKIEFNKSDISGKNDDAIFVSNDTGTVVFYTSDDNNLNFRSSFYESSEKGLFITVTKETLTDITNYLNKNYSIYLNIPYSIEETTINNVVGVIKGKDSTLPPLVFGAHFDHVGMDLSGTIYNGALDNGSGTAFLLHLAKYIKSLGIPDRDIIFVAFNAEEFGLKGSSAFVDKYGKLLSGSKVYNFDMIGSYDGTPLCIMAGKSDSVTTPMVEELTKVFENQDIYFNYLFDNSSDHASFRAAGIDAVTLIDNDTSRIHTPKDRIEYINEKAIARCFNVMKPLILADGYSSNIFYNNIEIILILSCVSVLLWSFVYYNIKKQ